MKGWQWANEQIINFGSNPDRELNSDRDTGKMCLGGGMHCPSASSFPYFSVSGLHVVDQAGHQLISTC